MQGYLSATVSLLQEANLEQLELNGRACRALFYGAGDCFALRSSMNMSLADINRSSLTSTEIWLFYFLKWYKCFLFLIVSCSLTSRAEFPLAIATMDGFGDGDLTISKLRNLCQKKQPKD